MPAKSRFTGKASESAVEVLPLIRTNALRVARCPLVLSMPEITMAKLQIMRAFARTMEYKTAPDADKKRSQLGEEENPISSRKLKAKNKIAKTVALAERINNELQMWVKRRGLKSEKMEEKEGGEDDTLWCCGFKA